MQAYFIKLFGYDLAANKTMLKVMQQAGDPDAAVKLMGHIFAAQEIWLSRCLNYPLKEGFSLWPNEPVETLSTLNFNSNEAWLNFLSSQTNCDDSIIYTNSKGSTFTNNLVDILTHVANHGTHHRAQIGQHLKAAGIALPMTDYIAYLRQPNF